MNSEDSEDSEQVVRKAIESHKDRLLEDTLCDELSIHGAKSEAGHHYLITAGSKYSLVGFSWQGHQIDVDVAKSPNA